MATGTIVDDDEPTLSIEDVSVGEDAGTAIFVVTLDTAGIQTLSVDYAATDVDGDGRFGLRGTERRGGFGLRGNERAR